MVGRRLPPLGPLTLVVILCASCTVSHRMQPVGPTDVRSQEGAVAMVEGTAEHGAYPCEARREGAGDGVRWFGPQREPDRRALADWCSGVGPVEFRPQPAFDRSLSSQGPDSTLTVATWNVNVGGGDLISFLQDELEYVCDARGPRRTGQHFALLVQEAHRASPAVPEASEGAVSRTRIAATPPNGPRLDIVQIAENCGLALFYVPSMRNGLEPGESGREDRGSAILSTLPLADPIAIEVPFEAQRRVAVAASVRGPRDTELRLASVHYDVAGNILRVLGTGGSMRVRQNAGLTEALDLVDPERDTPIVVAGDLNTWSSRETVVLRMLETYPDSPPPGKEKTRGDWPPDHLFFRAAGGAFQLVEGSYRVAEDTFGSDHKARLAALSLR